MNSASMVYELFPSALSLLGKAFSLNRLVVIILKVLPWGLDLTGVTLEKSAGVSQTEGSR